VRRWTLRRVLDYRFVLGLMIGLLVGSLLWPAAANWIVLGLLVSLALFVRVYDARERRRGA
jgi:hypothetical protein